MCSCCGLKCVDAFHVCSFDWVTNGSVSSNNSECVKKNQIIFKYTFLHILLQIVRLISYRSSPWFGAAQGKRLWMHLSGCPQEVRSLKRNFGPALQKFVWNGHLGLFEGTSEVDTCSMSGSCIRYTLTCLHYMFGIVIFVLLTFVIRGGYLESRGRGRRYLWGVNRSFLHTWIW